MSSALRRMRRLRRPRGLLGGLLFVLLASGSLMLAGAFAAGAAWRNWKARQQQ